MAIVVEDGTGVTGANSYISVSTLESYASDRGVTIAAVDTAAKEALLLISMDYIESLAYKGMKLRRDNALVWPRAFVWVDSWPVNTDDIPLLLRDGQAEAALAVDRSESQLADIDRKTKKEGLQPGMFIEYADNSNSVNIVRTINAKLHKLLISGISGISFQVKRA